MQYSKMFVLFSFILKLINHCQIAEAANEIFIQPFQNHKENSPREELRLSIFKNQEKTGCHAIKVHPKGRTNLDPSLNQFLITLIGTLGAKQENDLQNLFHPRLNISPNKLSEIKARLSNTYGDPLDFSIYRLWALNNVDGSPQLINCSEDLVSIYAQYGYPLQFGAWLQIMGSKELGRLYLSIVPTDGQWRIGAFHVQQWTHESKDSIMWSNEADKDSLNSMPISAYVKFDLAAKLADGGNLLNSQLYADFEHKRDSLMLRNEWEKRLKDDIAPIKPIYLGTLFVKGGAGILIRQKIKSELSVEEIKNDCRNLAQRLANKAWSKGIIGVRCSYNLEKEDANIEGSLGGIFQSFEDFKKSK